MLNKAFLNTLYRYRYSLKILIGLISSCLFILPCSLFAQNIGFLPRNILTVSYETESISQENVHYQDRNKRSLLENALSNAELDDNTASGSIRYESFRHSLSIQYGLFRTINLGMALPNITRKRISDLTLNDPVASSLVDNNGAAESSGLGDIEIWGLWRKTYSDEVDLQFGMTVDLNNGDYYYNQPEKLALGSGAQEISAFMRLRLYAIGSSFQTYLQLKETITLDSTITDGNDQEYTLSRGNHTHASAILSVNAGSLQFGGGIKMAMQGKTSIDDVGQDDGFQSYSSRLYLNYGNLYLLEESPISLPWEIQIHFENSLFGNNAPVTQKIGLNTSLYF